MLRLSDKQKAEFLRRCYTAVDGLWFVKLEEKLGFEKTLAVDREVWKVFPKIQARALKAMGKKGNGLAALADCFGAKLRLEGFTFTVKRRKDRVTFSVARCPWMDILVKSGRERLFRDISELICETEYAVWAREFGPGLAFALRGRLCCGARHCRLEFNRTQS